MSDKNKDAILAISRLLGIQSAGDGLMAKIRQTIDLLQEAAAERDQLKASVAELEGKAAPVWTSVAERLPDSAKPVLAHYLNSHGMNRIIRAMCVGRLTIEQDDLSDPDTSCVEYCEQDDCYYLLAGWYELINNWDGDASIAVNEGVITHWMPLPAAPSTEGVSDD